MTQERMLQSAFTSQSDAIQKVIRRTCIVDYGIIIAVLGQNVVKVGISVADNPEDVQIIVCTLVSLCSASFSVNIEPAVGDKVLVLFPRHFNPKMFDTEMQDPIIDATCKGYTRLSGLALLVNQFNSNSHTNNLQIDNKGVLTYAVGDNTVTLDLSDTQNKKILIQDSNGCTIETTSEGTVINGNLKVKK